jgi:hypothetical protein
MNVVFMTAEKWVVPDPIQYELLSLPKDAMRNDCNIDLTDCLLCPAFI